LPFRLRLTKLRFACFHVCVVDGVFEAQPDAESINAQSVSLHPAEIDDAAIAQVQANVRKRILRAFVARGHIEACDAKDMVERAASSSHGGGFSVDAGVRTRQQTAQGWSACCATARVHHSQWTASSSTVLIWSTAVAKGTQSRCSQTNTQVNWCSPQWS